MSKEMNLQSEGRDLRLLRAEEEEDKAARGQNSAGLGGMLLERGIAGDEHGGRIALEESPQVAVSRGRDRSGNRWRLADATIQRKLGQDRLDVRVTEAMTPADPGPQENLAVLGKKVERQQISETPAHHAFEHGGCR